MKHILCLTAILVSFLANSQAIQFERYDNHGIEGTMLGGLLSADFNGDGIDDIFEFGMSSVFPIASAAKINFGNGNGGFYLGPSQPFHSGGTDVYVKSAELIDFDRNGTIDIVASYTDSESQKVYISIQLNNGQGVFSELTTFEVSDYHQGSGVETLRLGDFDGDGDYDILISVNEGGENYRTYFYRNDGHGTFTRLTTDLPNFYGDAAVFDFDLDGKVDIVLSGWDGTEKISRLYRNIGNFQFEEAGATLGFDESRIAVGNIDNNPEGYESVIISGRNSAGNRSLEIYLNEGENGFRHYQSLPAADKIILADFDNDGWVDMFVTYGTGARYAHIYKNYRGIFILANRLSPRLSRAGAVAIDFDNDGFLDIIVSGGEGAFWIGTRGWKNITPPIHPKSDGEAPGIIEQKQ